MNLEVQRAYETGLLAVFQQAAPKENSRNLLGCRILSKITDLLGFSLMHFLHRAQNELLA